MAHQHDASIIMSSPYGDCEHYRQLAIDANKNDDDGVGDPYEETANPLRGAGNIFYGFQLITQCYGEIFQNSTVYNKYQGNVALQLALKFINDIHLLTNVLDITSEIYFVIALAVIWTLVRYFLVSFVFRPTAKWCGVQAKNIERLCESTWKALAYFVMWAYAVDVVFCRHYTFFYEPMKMFSDWSMYDKPPRDLALLYAIEFSFYLHCVYATRYMDAWRKDSPVMMTHHFVSMTLISFSYMIRCLKIGALIFVLNDISDVFLEGGKVATYMRHRTSGFSPFYAFVSDAATLLFVITWFVNRLWFHLTKVWRSAAFGLLISCPVLPLPFLLFLNIFLGMLYLFYIYWSWFILIFVSRTLFSNKPHGTAEDPREDDSVLNNNNNHGVKKQRHHASKSMTSSIKKEN